MDDCFLTIICRQFLNPMPSLSHHIVEVLHFRRKSGLSTLTLSTSIYIHKHKKKKKVFAPQHFRSNLQLLHLLIQAMPQMQSILPDLCRWCYCRCLSIVMEAAANKVPVIPDGIMQVGEPNAEPLGAEG